MTNVICPECHAGYLCYEPYGGIDSNGESFHYDTYVCRNPECPVGEFDQEELDAILAEEQN